MGALTLVRARGSVFVLTLAFAGCHRSSVTRAEERRSAAQDAPVAPSDASDASDAGRLPEDPVAGKQSELQWREHMAQEEHERQLGFDRKRLKEHRAVVKLIVAARARYDRARTAAAVAKVRTDMPRRIAEVRQRVTEIDRWGVNSRLLQDYDALATSLLDPYADAKVAAIKGDAHGLAQVRAGFDQHMKAIAAWLAEVAKSEDD